jgi:hypothetical protein
MGTVMGAANNEFEFDVAFSFLQQDETLAVKLNDLLRRQFRTFIYTEHQKKLAGTDGEVTFNKVFGDEARAVAILFRDGWGETAWTRIEQTAIRNRAHDFGYDFAVFISLDGSAPPRWVPRTRIYVGFERFGVDGAAAVLEARVVDLGGAAHPERLEDAAARKARELDFAQKSKTALEFDDGVRAFNRMKEELVQALESASARVNENQGHFKLSVDPDLRQGRIFIKGFHRIVTVEGGPRWANKIDDGELKTIMWNRAPPPKGYINIEPPEKFRQMTFRLGFTEGCNYVWLGERDRRFSVDQLAEHILHWAIELS